MTRALTHALGLPAETVRPLVTASDNNRGSCVHVGPDHINDLVTIVDVTTPCPGVAEPIQITLAVDVDAGSAADCLDAFVLPQIRALITWGVGGTYFQAEVDFLNGTLISLSAETIKVQAFYKLVTVPEGCCPECLPTFRVKAALGYGCISRAQLTEIVVLSGEGDCERVEIPPFARSVSVMTSDGEPVDVDVVGFGTCFRTGCRVKACGEDHIPIWNGAKFVEVRSRTDHQPITVALVFELAI